MSPVRPICKGIPKRTGISSPVHAHPAYNIYIYARTRLGPRYRRLKELLSDASLPKGDKNMPRTRLSLHLFTYGQRGICPRTRLSPLSKPAQYG
jgi:hypothetical protein